MKQRMLFWTKSNGAVYKSLLQEFSRYTARNKRLDLPDLLVSTGTTKLGLNVKKKNCY